MERLSSTPLKYKSFLFILHVKCQPKSKYFKFSQKSCKKAIEEPKSLEDTFFLERSWGSFKWERETKHTNGLMF